ncbi:DUF6449 domain-containing protein [Rossellomorea aquimaris]|uniref:DUF6449 domain-containing protein n=1 Tax=Rossellomorea aquimaris TaxID=189382 RepID=UPI0007D06DAC|nr:DUF6449 domain-containing protein [Rossellomorea aquimaris]
MPSKTSWINKELMIQNLRNVGWVGIVYFIGLLFSLPIDIIGKLSNDDPFYAIYDNLFKMQYPIQIWLMLIIPVILSLFLFRFLHVKQATDFIHSLPIKRSKLFLHFTIMGFGILIIPILLNTVILLSLYAFTDFQQFVQVQDIFIWCGITILMNTLFFTTATFIAMVTGLTAVQGALTYILLLFPAGMFMLVCFSLKDLLFGFPEDYFFNIQIEKYSPIIKASYLENEIFSWWDACLFLFISIIFYVLSFFLYKTRKVEVASQSIVFPVLRPIFKFGVAFCTMLVGGLYFNEIQQQQGWIWFGYFVGSLFGYYLAEMVLQKHWRVFKQWKGYAGFLVVIGLIGLLIHFDLFQYEKKVPDLDDVEAVHISSGYYHLMNNNQEVYIKDPFIKESNSIEAVLSLHESIVEKQEKSERNMEEYERIFLYYKLKDGSKLVRDYSIKLENYKSYYASIYESKNFKETTEQIFQVDTSKVDKLTIYPDMGGNKRVAIVDPEEIQEAINILKDEVYNTSFEDRGKVHLYNVELLLSTEKWMHVGVKNNYKQFEDWLREKGYLEEIQVTSDDIEWMYVINQREYGDRIFNSMDQEQAVMELMKENKGIEINDSPDIQKLMNHLNYGNMKNQYLVAVKYKAHKGYIEIRGLTEQDTPAFIKDYINENE